jgi:hypothetical protein
MLRVSACYRQQSLIFFIYQSTSFCFYLIIINSFYLNRIIYGGVQFTALKTCIERVLCIYTFRKVNFPFFCNSLG